MVINKILNDDVFNHINYDLINYYFSPGNIYNLLNFANSNNIDIKEINIETFLNFFIKNNYFKKDLSFKYLLYDYIELCLKNTSINLKNNYYSYFIDKINNLKKFNLDEESFFIEFQNKILNG